MYRARFLKTFLKQEKIEESEKRVVFFDVDLRKRVYDRLKRR